MFEDDEETSNHAPPPSDAFENAPNLRSLSLAAPSGDLKFSFDLEFPFSQLFDLAITNAPADYLVRVCQEASNLTRLTIAMNSMSSHFLAMPLCTLSCLKSLVAYDFSTPDYYGSLGSPSLPVIEPSCRIGTLLAKFSCPILNEITIHTFPQLPESDYPSFKNDIVSFFARSPLITRIDLDVRLNYDDSNILLDILEYCPSLEQLKINHQGVFTATLFERLTYNTAATELPLCPRLRVFDGGHHHKPVSVPALVNMVASRWHVADDAPVARLQSLTMTFDDADCAAQLGEFAAEGLKLTLHKPRNKQEMKMGLSLGRADSASGSNSEGNGPSEQGGCT
ncbi:hypothetical protein MVEN_00508600 [Mycena venus]|uniref:F-box domain-containing protein n=1 Tax=Mycena venus TaxID=2733690 RepID=A0A8H6YMB5_9AGAR|nr:hypothetical protein MVEN_00508600 [Mycena venus]